MLYISPSILVFIPSILVLCLSVCVQSVCLCLSLPCTVVSIVFISLCLFLFRALSLLVQLLARSHTRLLFFNFPPLCYGYYWFWSIVTVHFRFSYCQKLLPTAFPRHKELNAHLMSSFFFHFRKKKRAQKSFLYRRGDAGVHRSKLWHIRRPG